MMDGELLKILACPWCVTRPEAHRNTLACGELALVGPVGSPEALRCCQCGRQYKIENGIPNLLVEEATQANAG